MTTLNHRMQGVSSSSLSHVDVVVRIELCQCAGSCFCFCFLKVSMLNKMVLTTTCKLLRVAFLSFQVIFLFLDSKVHV